MQIQKLNPIGDINRSRIYITSNDVKSIGATAPTALVLVDNVPSGYIVLPFYEAVVLAGGWGSASPSLSWVWTDKISILANSLAFLASTTLTSGALAGIQGFGPNMNGAASGNWAGAINLSGLKLAWTNPGTQATGNNNGYIMLELWYRLVTLGGPA